MGQYLKQDESGLSLIELLISLGICVTALMGLAQVLAIGVAARPANSQSLARSKATSLAKFQLEALKAVPFDDAQLAAGGSLPPAASVANYADQVDIDGQVVGVPSIHTRQWAIVDVAPNLKQITVATTRNGLVMGTRITIQLTTLRTRG